MIACDLATDAASLPARVAELGLEVDLLVNNAGFGTHGRFARSRRAATPRWSALNCEAVVVLTRAFLPAMIERGRGGVITVASTAGMQPLPYEATYAASKAFALNFSDALHAELRGHRRALPGGQPRPGADRVAGGRRASRSRRSPPGHDRAPSRCVRESLAAYDRGARSLVPGTMIRWMMRAADGPRAVKLRMMERAYRPRSGG